MSEPTQEKKEPKLVKIRTLRPVLVDRSVDKFGGVQGRIVAEGQEIMVSEADAKLFCDTRFTGHYAFGGERYEDPKGPKDPDNIKFHDYRRAVRVLPASAAA